MGGMNVGELKIGGLKKFEELGDKAWDIDDTLVGFDNMSFAHRMANNSLNGELNAGDSNRSGSKMRNLRARMSKTNMARMSITKMKAAKIRIAETLVSQIRSYSNRTSRAR